LKSLLRSRSGLNYSRSHKMRSRKWLKRLSRSIAPGRRSLSDCLCAREPPRSFARCAQRCRNGFKRRPSQHTNSGPRILGIRRCDSRRSTKRFPFIQYASIGLGARSACSRKTPLSGFGWAPMKTMRCSSNAYKPHPEHCLIGRRLRGLLVRAPVRTGYRFR
jgi:hypothetical protein